MPYFMKTPGGPWLYNSTTGDFAGLKDPDGSELIFARAPHTGGFFDVSNQTALANTATPMEYDTTDFSHGVSVVSNSQITVTRASVYNIQFSAQFKNTDNSSEHNVSVWLALNGTNVANSNTQITLPRKHGGGDGLLVAAWNFFVTMNAGQYAQIIWSTPNTAVSIAYEGTLSTPTRPATPSVNLTVNEVNGIS